MDDLIDMMVKDASASAISDKIKDILMQKSAANIDAVRPQVAASMFGATGAEVEADACLLYTSPSPRDATLSRMPSSA